MITIQYLEPGPHLIDLTPDQVGRKLQAALERLPIDCILLGWDLPPVLENVCQDVSARADVKLYRWQPLLTGDGTIYPERKWRSQNIKGMPHTGFHGLPEFTFVCPNNPIARQAILSHIANLAQSGRYDGIFLDRMRYPSPAADPVNLLTCFCNHCNETAQKIGLDLIDVRQSLLEIDESNLLRVLCGEQIQPLSTFLDFRQHTITQFINDVVDSIRSAGLEIGLDCFSPSLTRLVGQDLSALAHLADWIKVMVYGHAFGPATLPFEFNDLAIWLIEEQGIDETAALSILTTITTLPLPTDLLSLRVTGLHNVALAAEYIRGKQIADSTKVLAGIELVEIPGVSELKDAQIEEDLHAIEAVSSDGLSLSWDLWHIPLERLDIVRSVFFSYF